MIRKLLKPGAIILVFSFLVCQPVAYGAPIVSKTLHNQTLDERAAELSSVRVRLGVVSTALGNAGLSQEQVQARLAQLSTSDLVALAETPAQIKPAGVTMSKKLWTMTGIAVGAVAVGAFAVQQKDDGEDDDAGEDD